VSTDQLPLPRGNTADHVIMCKHNRLPSRAPSEGVSRTPGIVPWAHTAISLVRGKTKRGPKFVEKPDCRESAADSVFVDKLRKKERQVALLILDVLEVTIGECSRATSLLSFSFSIWCGTYRTRKQRKIRKRLLDLSRFPGIPSGKGEPVSANTERGTGAVVASPGPSIISDPNIGQILRDANITLQVKPAPTKKSKCRCQVVPSIEPKYRRCNVCTNKALLQHRNSRTMEENERLHPSNWVCCKLSSSVGCKVCCEHTPK